MTVYAVRCLPLLSSAVLVAFLQVAVAAAASPASVIAGAGAGAAATPSQAMLDLQGVELIGTTDRNPVQYGIGEAMMFTIRPNIDVAGLSDEYFINWTRSGDDGQTVEGRAKLADGPVMIQTAIDRPGFVRIQAFLTDGNGQKLKKTVHRWGRDELLDIAFDGGAGAAVDVITQASPEPEDFDAFWQRQAERLAAVPLRYTMEKVSSTDGIDTYAVTVECAGPRPVTGYLTLPADAKDQSLPARIVYQGYGVNPQRPHKGRADTIVFEINAHGFLLGQDRAYYQRFGDEIKSNGQSYAMDPQQNANPEESYFNGMALRVLRSLEFVKALPQWDRRTLVVNGGSQGGLQALWAAALDADVTVCESGITWCSDWGGHALGGRLNGWRPRWVGSLDYYDAANHAKRIRCPVVITRASLGDYVCPPSGLAVLYNAITAPKKISWMQGSTHGHVPTKPEVFVEQKNWDASSGL